MAMQKMLMQENNANYAESFTIFEHHTVLMIDDQHGCKTDLFQTEDTFFCRNYPTICIIFTPATRNL